MAYTTLAMRSWADVLFDIDGWYKLADLAYLPVLLPAAAAAAAQPILDGAIAEVTKEQDRLMLCSFSEAIDPIVHEIHTTLVEHSMWVLLSLVPDPWYRVHALWRDWLGCLPSLDHVHYWAPRSTCGDTTACMSTHNCCRYIEDCWGQCLGDHGGQVCAVCVCVRVGAWVDS